MRFTTAYDRMVPGSCYEHWLPDLTEFSIEFLENRLRNYIRVRQSLVDRGTSTDYIDIDIQHIRKGIREALDRMYNTQPL